LATGPQDIPCPRSWRLPNAGLVEPLAMAGYRHHLHHISAKFADII
jgi:hypothetical protein